MLSMAMMRGESSAGKFKATFIERLIFAILFALFVAIIYVYQIKTSERVVQTEQSQLRMASGMLQAMKSAHDHYTKNIFNSDHPEVQKIKDIVQTPVAFAKEIGKEMGKEMDGLHSSIYSYYPFPGSDVGVFDNFQTYALETLSKGKQTHVWRVEQSSDDIGVLRYAEPMVMKEVCLTCHNSPQYELNKQDWKVGDIRGIWEISLPVDPRVTTSFLSIEFALGILGLGLVSLGLLTIPYMKRHNFERNQLATMNVRMARKALRYEKDSLTDSLTGACNRRAFDNDLSRVLQSDNSSDEAHALFIIDLDHFKSINDRFGHDAGDATLKGIVSKLATSARQHDKVYRIGGEEFAMILENVGQSQIIEIAERVRIEIENLEWMFRGEKLSITASIGVTACKPEEKPKDVRNRADQALYQAKKDGRNQVCLVL